MHMLLWPALQVQNQRGFLFPWSPVFLGIGICLYFMARTEPPSTHLWAAGGVALLCMLGALLRAGTATALVLSALALTAAGYGLAGWRAHDVAAPVLGWPYYGPVEGRVVKIDRSGSDAIRITLDQVRMGRISDARTPARVRISLHGLAAELPTPSPGMRVMTTARISPPGGPVEPGGFDFQRHSWFLQLGGVGYTRVPMVGAAAPELDSMAMRIFHVRMAISQYVREALPGDVGGFAAAVTSGDRSGMSQDALHNLRASNLAHLLAISGLHMGLLTGFVFAVLRYGLVLIPPIALRWPTRKIAAFGALVVGAFYLAMSGGNIATERAFTMVAVALCAVMVNRRAISLRSIAIAALIVLFLRPEALLGPGFQMSFSATIVLVAVFNFIRDAPWKFPKWAQGISSVLIASAVSGWATAPIAAAHFNVMSHYGLVANLVSVPVMGTLVVPAAVLAVLLAPLGLSQIGLWLMGLGLWWILEVAEFTASLPGARTHIISPDPWVLPIITLGALFVVIWRGHLRWVGVLPMLAALAMWGARERPDVLISDTGGIVGVMTEDGRALSRPRGSGFIATNWLENDGDGAEQEPAHDRWISTWQVKGQANVDGARITHVTGKKASAQPPDCAGGILISNAELGSVPSDCRVFDPDALKETGAVALYGTGPGTFQMKTARQVAGERLWSQWPEASEPRKDQYVRIKPTSLP